MTSERAETVSFEQAPFSADAPDGPARPLWTAIGRGLRCRCPECGEGKIFSGYLTTVERCAYCDLYIGGHSADDLPPYLTIFIVGHVIVALFMAVDDMAAPSLWASIALFVPVTIVLSLALLRPLKGATVGLQWAMRMHGFGEPEPVA